MRFLSLILLLFLIAFSLPFAVGCGRPCKCKQPCCPCKPCPHKGRKPCKDCCPRANAPVMPPCTD